MAYVVLQQVSSAFARRNAGKTLDHAIALKYIQKFIAPEEFEELQPHYPSGAVFVWGAKVERGHQIERLLPGKTLVLFRRGKRVFGCAAILDLVLNIQLAGYLWGRDTDGCTWPIVFLMKTIRRLSVEASEINSIIGHNKRDNWQGMIALHSDASSKVIEYIRGKLAP